MVANEVVHVPSGYPTSTIFLDESGSKGKDLFTIGGIKLRRPGAFAREMKDLRDRHDFQGELKFNRLNKGSLRFTNELIDLLCDSDAHIVACVIDPKKYNPFKNGDHRWKAHAQIAAQLLAGCINRRELVSVLMDGISTPRGCSLADTVKDDVNKRFKATSVVSVTCLDSRTNDLLQVADMVASAVAYERRVLVGSGTDPASPKGVAAARLGVAFGNVGLVDGRNSRSNIATMKGKTGFMSNVTPLRKARNSA